MNKEQEKELKKFIKAEEKMFHGPSTTAIMQQFSFVKDMSGRKMQIQVKLEMDEDDWV